MTNQERIQAHNASLRECIEVAEGLPDAGTTETWVFEMEDGSTVTKEVVIQ